MERVGEAAIALSAASRELRRQLRPLTWVTLEEVALDAVSESGRLVACTSARLVAERLGVAPAAAAGALRVLRQRGLLVLDHETRPDRRFGLSVYRLEAVPGLAVVEAGRPLSPSSSLLSTAPGTPELGRGLS